MNLSNHSPRSVASSIAGPVASSIDASPFSLSTFTPSKAPIAPRSLTLLTLLGLITFASTTNPASAQAINFGSVNACPAGKTTPAPCSANQTVTFSIPAGTTISSIAILTTGIADLDFKAKADDASATLCKAQHYSAATTCTVDVTFTPLAPGARNGAVVLLGSDGGAVVAQTYVYGIGIGPQVAFTPAPLLSRGSGLLSGGNGIAVDASGDIYVADVFNQVIQIVAADSDTTIKTLKVPYPSSLALDGAGNIFVIDHDYAGIEEIFAAGGYTTSKTLARNLRAIFDLVVDPTGNIFYVDYLNDDVKEILAAGGYTTVKTLGSGQNGPTALAIDAAGNLFVSDTDSIVKEILAAGGYTTVKTLVKGLGSGPIAVDATDNIFLAYEDSATKTNVVSEIVADGGYTTVTPLNIPLGYLALDSSGNLYSATGGSSIPELLRSQPPAFAFGNAVVGTTSSDSPLSAIVQNTGNATLIGSGLTLTGATDFSLVAGSATPPDCASSFSLAPSVECSLNVDFTAQSFGPATGSLVLTDNAGNETGATQSIALSGAGVTAVPQVSPSILQFGAVPYPGSATQPLTLTNTGTGTLTIDPSSNGRGAIITGNTCGAGIGAGKSCTLQVEFKPVQLGPNGNAITIQTNGLSSPKVPVRGTATGVGSLSTALDFGTVKGRGNTDSLPLYITNYGVPGTVSVATSTGATTFHVTFNYCTAGIAAGSSCQIGVEFAPVSTGPATAYLKLIPSTGPEQTIVMTGTLVP